MQTVTTHAGANLVIGGRACTRDNALAALGGQLDALPRNVSQTSAISDAYHIVACASA